MLAAMKAVDFELEFDEDLVEKPDAIPWYYPLVGDFSMISSI